MLPTIKNHLRYTNEKGYITPVTIIIRTHFDIFFNLVKKQVTED